MPGDIHSPTRASVKSGSRPEVLGHQPRVLIVDDERQNRQLLEVMLALEGFVLLTAASGEEALAIVAQQPPDLVLLDIMMPAMDGYEVAIRIKEDPAGRNIPIVMVTALDDREAKMRGLNAGAEDFVTKPVDRAELVVRVRNLLRLKAYGDYHDQYSRMLEDDVASRTADLAASERLYRSTFDEAPVGITHVGVDGRWLRVNQHLCDLLGYSQEELQADGVHALLQSEELPREAELRRQITAGVLDGYVIDEKSYRRRSGDFLWARVKVSVHRDATGRCQHLIWVILDITERRRLDLQVRKEILERERAEVAMRQERDRAQQYLDTAAVIILALDMDGRVTLVNRHACALLGRSAEELLGSDWTQTCLPLRLRSTFRKELHHLAGAGTSIVEHPVLTSAGEERLIEWRNTILQDDAGQRVGTLSSGTDITDRNQAIEALRTAEERMRFALQNAEVGIWDMDYTTGVLRWSETLESQYGLQRGTFSGSVEAFVQHVHPDDRRSVIDQLATAVASGTDFSLINRSIWPDGTVRWLSGRGRIHHDEHGEPVRGVGISLDVTERHNLEEQYHQAQKMEAIGRLAGGVAHDFNSLLTVILGYCELLLLELNPADSRQVDIREIQQAAVLAAGITRQLLTFSRKQIVEPTLLDLNGVVTDMQAMLERLLGEDLNVILTLRPGLALMRADHGQVEQIVMNLAINARDAMPEGGTLTIETADVALDGHYAMEHVGVDPGPYVALTVTDTGTGMSPQVQARLFEPFFTTKEVGKGTGLGLATVHGIVALTGGSVTVSSAIGRGTSFTVYFPAANGAASVVDAPPPAIQKRAWTQTVLVVEDTAALRALIKRFLERQGYTVLLAANAQDARELFLSNPSIDVLLTDVVMPGTSGPELGRQFVEQRPALKVIYMSGYTDDAIAHHGVLKPGIAFLHKPFNSETLGQKVRDVFAQ